MDEAMLGQTDKLKISTAVTIFFLFYSVIIVIAWLPGSFLLQDGDTYWHIRTGQWILAHKQFPVVDLYSYTELGKRWISGEWLSEVLFAIAYRIDHWRGVVLLTTFAIASILTILCFYLLQRLRFSIAVGWTAIIALAISVQFLARPHIFADIPLLIWVITLVEAYDNDYRNLKRYAFVLGPLMIIWANVHGSFTLGLVTLFIFTAFAVNEKTIERNYVKALQIGFVALGISLCALVNPYGINSALLTLKMTRLSFVLHHIAEWRSPDFQHYRIHLLLIIGFVTALFGMGIRLRGPKLAALGLLLYLALSYLRGLPLFFLIIPVLFARPLSTYSVWWRSTQLDASGSDPILEYWGRRPAIIPTFFLSGAIILTVCAWQSIDKGPPSSITPKAALAFVKKAGITGNVFNSYGFGGYLIFSGIPTFIDSRQPPYTDDFVRKYFEAVDLMDIKKAFELLEQYHVSWALLSPTEPLVKALAQSDLWTEPYSDKYSVVFVRRR